MTAAELAGEPVILYERGGTIRRVVDDWFRRGRATPRIAMELGNAEATKKLVGAGLGLSVVSEIAVKGRREDRRVEPDSAAPAAPPEDRDRPETRSGAAAGSAGRRDRARKRREASAEPGASLTLPGRGGNVG